MVASHSRQLRLTSISARLKKIDDARAHLLYQLAELDAESQALSRERGSIMNDNAAISMLPNEILATIFELAYSSPRFDVRQFEILVSSVTKH